VTLDLAWVPSTGAVRFTVTGNLPTTQTVKRVAPGNALQVIRGYGDSTWWLNPNTFGYDYEMPLGVTVRYAVVDITATSLPVGAEVNSILTMTPGRDNEAWLRDILQPVLSQRISVLSTGEETRVARQAVYDIVGKPTPVVVWDSRSSRQGTITLGVENTPTPGVWNNDTYRDRIDRLLTSGRPLLLSICDQHGFKPCYMAVANAGYTRMGKRAAWVLTLDYVEVDNPTITSVYPAPEVTYGVAQQIPPDAHYSDWAPVTYYDIATRSSP
jgi:hypothetical protein